MYRNPAKVFHWDIWMFLALGLSIISTAINIYATNTLSKNQAIFEVGKSLLLISISLILINYLLESISNYRELTTDVRLRKILLQSKTVNSSIVNIDINIAIGVIHFYAFAPGSIFATLVYSSFLAINSTYIFFVLLFLSVLIVVPVKKYIEWRGSKIQLIRKWRNRLLDEYQIGADEYENLINKYSDVYKSFLKFDVGIGFIFVILIAFSVYAVYHFSPNDESRLSTLAVYLLLTSQLRSLVLSLSVFQENKKSLTAVEAHIQDVITGRSK